MEKNFIPVSQNLLSDPKVLALAEIYGSAGAVGHWVITLLSLYGNSGMPLKPNGVIFSSQAKLHGFSEAEMRGFYATCSEVGLIDSMLYEETGQVYNDGVFQHVTACKKKSEKLANAGRKGGQKSRKNKPDISVA